MAKGQSRKELENQREEERKRKSVLEHYKNRLYVLKTAMDQSRKENYKEAIENYKNYLFILAGYCRVEERQLGPKLFRGDKDLTELLLISHVYWDMAKIFDKNPKLSKECERCLAQFVKFSMGFKYQFVNSEILRKYIKVGRINNSAAFKEALIKLRTHKGGCYLATYCFGYEHPITLDLRVFRDKIIMFWWGRVFTNIYYFLSPKMVEFSHKYPKIGLFLKNYLFSPIISRFSKLVSKF